MLAFLCEVRYRSTGRLLLRESAHKELHILLFLQRYSNFKSANDNDFPRVEEQVNYVLVKHMAKN